jgi:hypothetical protein
MFLPRAGFGLRFSYLCFPQKLELQLCSTMADLLVWMGSHSVLAQALNCDPSDLYFPSSRDYRSVTPHQPPLSFFFFDDLLEVLHFL